MRNFVIKSGRIIAVLALLASIGGHWALLQSVAWTQMILERSGETSFGEAVKSTFSGDAPCAMCRRIAEETQKEKKPEQIQIKQQLDLIFETKVIALFPPDADRPSLPAAMLAAARAEQPPIPPPRRA